MTATFGPLVSTAWLAEHLEDPDLRVLDCTMRLVPFEGRVRPENARDTWTAGHIPGSDYVDLLAELSDTASRLPMMMPPPDRFAAAMAAHGVGEGTRVVLYDGGGLAWATRVWWMLRAVGFDSAAVLDGGLARWTHEGRALSTEAPRVRPARFVPRPRPGTFVDRATVEAALGRTDVRLVNALGPDEHAGRVSRAARPGRIPGSVNVPASSLIASAESGFRPLEALRERFAAAGVLDAPHVITYCGGGISATVDAFTLLRLGVQDVAVYDGSLAEWSADPSLPLETG